MFQLCLEKDFLDSGKICQIRQQPCPEWDVMYQLLLFSGIDSVLSNGWHSSIGSSSGREYSQLVTTVAYNRLNKKTQNSSY